VQNAAKPIDADHPDYVSALARGLEVIRAFGEGHERMTVSDLARITGLARATVRRSLLTLHALGYIASDGKYFSLTPSILSLGFSYLGATPLPRIVQPALESLSETLQESCSVSVLDGHEIVYVARSATRRIMSVGLAVGSRLPAYCSSMGRVLLAFQTRAVMDEVLAVTPLLTLTPHTLTDPDKIRSVLHRVRGQGYCLVDQELEIGLMSLAVPVRNASGKVVAAMNISVQAGRMSPADLIAKCLPLLQQAAAGVAPALVN